MSRDATLFRIQENDTYRYFLYGMDEYQRFVAELVAPANTVKEAYETMKPQAVKDREANNIELKRQGEWFLIPTFLRDEEVVNLESACFKSVPKYDGDRIYQPIEEFDYRDLGTLNAQEQEQALKITRKEKYTPAITEGSNHLVQHKGIIPLFYSIGFNVTVVKGYVRHVNRDHQKIVLDTWHVAVHNIVKQAYQVVASGRTGGFD
jgi:hypothetical protein